MKIDSFDGEYAFLSNFYPSPIKGDDGIMYPTVEHFFQAMKTEDLDYRQRIAWAATPGQAKRMGRKLELRPDWELVKGEYMWIGLVKKFSFPEMKKLLLDTDDATLIEGNTWHDNCWGNCTCEKCVDKAGLNRLGSLLMDLREEFRYGE